MAPVVKNPDEGLNAAVAAQLRAERAAADLTMQQLADRAEIPLVSVQRYLRAKRDIDIATLYALCEALGVEPFDVVAAAQTRLLRADLVVTDPVSVEGPTFDHAVAAHEEEVPIVGEHGESDTP